jgi:hypothetical protein
LGALPADTPNWERTALTLEVEPEPPSQNPGGFEEPQLSAIGLADSRPLGNSVWGNNVWGNNVWGNNIVSAQSVAQSVDGQVADWMVAGLSPDANGGVHANP